MKDKKKIIRELDKVADEANPWKDQPPLRCDISYPLLVDAIKLLKEQEGLTLALEQANATINYLNEEKENAIKEIEERKDFNLKCDGQPEWLRKGIDIGLNTALDILKGKAGEVNGQGKGC